MGKNARKAVLEEYNWLSEEKKLLKFYESLDMKIFQYSPLSLLPTDDGEFGYGGTISKLVNEGVRVIYVAFSLQNNLYGMTY